MKNRQNIILIEALGKPHLLVLNEVREKILTMYDYPELIVPNLDDIIWLAYDSPKYNSEHAFSVSNLIQKLNCMDHNALTQFASDLYYRNAYVAYRDRKPTLLPFTSDIKAFECSENIKEYLSSYRIVTRDRETIEKELLDLGIDQKEFYSVLKEHFNISLLPQEVHTTLRENANDAYLHKYILFTPNDIVKYGLYSVAGALSKGGLVPTQKQINDRITYNKEVEQIYNSIVLAEEKEV